MDEYTLTASPLTLGREDRGDVSHEHTENVVPECIRRIWFLRISNRIGNIPLLQDIARTENSVHECIRHFWLLEINYTYIFYD